MGGLVSHTRVRAVEPKQGWGDPRSEVPDTSAHSSPPSAHVTVAAPTSGPQTEPAATADGLTTLESPTPIVAKSLPCKSDFLYPRDRKSASLVSTAPPVPLVGNLPEREGTEGLSSSAHSGHAPLRLVQRESMFSVQLHGKLDEGDKARLRTVFGEDRESVSREEARRVIGTRFPGGEGEEWFSKYGEEQIGDSICWQDFVRLYERLLLSVELRKSRQAVKEKVMATIEDRHKERDLRTTVTVSDAEAETMPGATAASSSSPGV